MTLSTEEILALRPPIIRPLPSLVPVDVLQELEAADVRGNVANVTTVLLRGSECSFRCTMCDLWQSTHLGPTPVGNLPAQIRTALSIPNEIVTSYASRWIKLYNASNFFAPYNVPTEDLPAIAELVRGFDRVIVENHPLLTSPKIADFARLLRRAADGNIPTRRVSEGQSLTYVSGWDGKVSSAARLNGQLEVAMGLETVDSTLLRNLNKQVTVDEVRRATEQLTSNGVDVRLFVLLRPPGLSEAAGIECCLESIEAAREWGARHVSVIPVRGGNGAMEKLQANGQFEPPLASSLEQVMCESVSKSPMVITADLWDWARLRGLCARCRQPRLRRMQNVNLTQNATDLITCECSRRINS